MIASPADEATALRAGFKRSIAAIILLSVFAISLLGQIEAVADSKTVLIDHFNQTSAGETIGAPPFAAGLLGLGNTLDLKQGQWVRYSLEGDTQNELNDAGTIELWINPRHHDVRILDINWSVDLFNYPPAGHVLHLQLNEQGRITIGGWPPACGLDPGIRGFVGNSTVPLNTWSHIAISWGEKTKTYINGKLDSSSDICFRPHINGRGLYLNYWGESDLGRVDELHVSKTQRTDTEIASRICASGCIPNAITLTPATSPGYGQPGTIVVSVTGAGFPSGRISPQNVKILLEPLTPGDGPSASVEATGVTTVLNTTRRVSFIVPPSFVFSAPKEYLVSVSGSTDSNKSFASSRAARMTINPPARLVAVKPQSAAPGSTLKVDLVGQYTNFVQGSTSVDFGSDITVSSLTVSSPTTASIQLTISPSATHARHIVRVVTGSQVASLVDGFEVIQADKPCIPPLPGLLGWWPGDGDATDLANGLNGVLRGGAGFGPGFVGQSFSFGPAIGHVFVESTPALNLREAVTISAWVKPASYVTPRGVSVTGHAVIAGRPFSYQMAIEPDGRVGFGVPIDGRGLLNTSVETITTIPKDAYTLVTGTYEAATGAMRIYVNGNLERKTILSGLIDSSDRPFEIGGFAGPDIPEDYGSLTGNVDEVMLFKRALTPLEVGQIYGVGSAGFCKDGAARPRISRINPASSAVGESVVVKIDGVQTHFVQGLTTVSLGDGITVNSVTVSDATHLAANLSIAAAAALGLRTVAVTTGPEVLSLANGFTVTTASTNQAPLVSAGLDQTIPLASSALLKGSIVDDGLPLNTTLSATWSPLSKPLSAGNQYWLKLAPTGLLPSPRNEAGLVLDPVTKHLIVFGGHVKDDLANDVWVLSGANGLTGFPTWTQLQPTGTAPVPRYGQGTFYDQTSNRMVTFGGATSGAANFLNEVWMLTHANGMGGAPAWVRLSPAGAAPSPRTYAAVAYDAATNRMIVFGGFTSATSQVADIWVLTNANGTEGTPPTWIQLAPTGNRPSNRSNSFVSFDPVSKRLIVFGGQTAGDDNISHAFNDTWVLTNANGLGGSPRWILLTPDGAATSPTQRLEGGVAYSHERNTLTISGGLGNCIAVHECSDFSDVWSLSNANGLGGSATWTQWAPIGGPPAPVAGGVYDEASDRLVFFGGGGSYRLPIVFFNDTWILTNATGSDRGGIPGAVTFDNQSFSTLNVSGHTSPVNTNTHFVIPGSYVLRLTGNDSQLSSTADVTVIVQPPSGTPIVTSAAPHAGQPGQVGLWITITGQNTNFVPGTTTVSLGAGVTVNSVTVASPVRLLAEITIAADAVPGFRTVTVTTAEETLSLVNGFNVKAAPANQPPIINTGSDQTITLPAAATLNATVIDDGLPLASTLIGHWSVVSGPIAAGQRWIQTKLPVALPTATQGANSVFFDAATNRLIVFGGTTNDPSDDVWILSGANGLAEHPTWTKLKPASGGPGPRYGQGAFYDHHSNRLIVFGGIGPKYPQTNNDVWILTHANGTGGSPAWIRVAPTGPLPSPRFNVGIGFDPSSNRMIVFGGSIWADSGTYYYQTNEVWILTNANGTEATAPTWVSVSPIGTSPVGRSNPVIAYDSASNRLIAFGGYIPYTLSGSLVSETLSDAWVLRNANGLGGLPTWISLTADGASSAPARRAAGIVAYNTANNTLTVGLGVGNCTNSPSRCFPFFDVWALKNANGLGGAPSWQQLEPTGGPPKPANSSAYDPTSDRLIGFSGHFGETWILTNATNSDPAPPKTAIFSNPTSSLPNTAGHSMAATTNATFTRPGSYVVRLTASDSELSAFDEVKVTVIGSTNRAPTVDAGLDVVLTFPTNTITLIGSMKDDGQPPDATFAYSWTSISGPAPVTFSNPLALTTNALFSASGVYTLRLSISDTELIGFDELTVTVKEGPSPATVSAISPSSAHQGDAVSIDIEGRNTHFVQNATTLHFGEGITVTALSVTDAQHLTAHLLVSETAELGTRTVVAITGLESASLVDSFTVHPGMPVLVSVSSSSGLQGQTLDISIHGRFTHFVAGRTKVSFGPGISVGGAEPGTPGPVSVKTPSLAEATISLSARPEWSERIPIGTVPDSRYISAQAYDPISNTLIVVNGYNYVEPWREDIWWLRDAVGNSAPRWEKAVAPTRGPGLRVAAMAAYDSSTDRMMLFGGFYGSTAPCSDELWLLKNAAGRNGSPTWEELPKGPHRRWGHDVAYDSKNNVLMLFAGTDCANGADLGDLWVLSNANGLGGVPVWTQLTPTGTGPGTKRYHRVAYDETTNRLIVVGGSGAVSKGSPTVGDVWVIENANGLSGTPRWLPILASGPVASVSALNYAAATNELIAVDNDCNSSATWKLLHANGVGGESRWERFDIFQQTLPARILMMAGAYAAKDDQLIIHGGTNVVGYCIFWPNTLSLSDTWVLSPAHRGAKAGPRDVFAATGSESVKLLNGFRVDSSFTGPAVEISPPYARLSTKLSIGIRGIGTPFSAGQTMASFGPGISVGSAPEGDFGPVRVLGADSAIADLEISAVAALGKRDVEIRTGTTSIRPSNGFLVMSESLEPTVLSIEPRSIARGQSSLVEILGSNTHFVQGASIVTFGNGVIATTVTVTSEERILAHITAASSATLGIHAVVVTTGEEKAWGLNGLEVIAAPSSLPSLTLISPNNLGQNQRATLVIEGRNTHFSNLTNVSFGAGITVGSISATDATHLTISISISDTASPGLRNVVVTTGSEVVTAFAGFTVVAETPTITSVNPASARQGTSVSVTIDAKFTHFLAGTTTAILGEGITVTSVVVANSTSLTLQLTVASRAVLGKRTVALTTGSETVTLTDVFTVQPGLPVLLSVAPNSGHQGQTFNVVVTSQFTNFSPSTILSFGSGITINSKSVDDATHLTANLSVSTSASVGTRTVTATTGSEVAILASGFTVTPGAPLLISVGPASGQRSQKVPVTITGQNTNFVSGITSINAGTGIAVSGVNVVSPVIVEANFEIAVNAVLGARSIVVTTGTEVLTLAVAFMVENGTPLITEIDPNVVRQGETRNITIKAAFTSFSSGTTIVDFGSGITVNSVSVTDSTTLTANITAADSAGMGSRTIAITTGSEVVSVPSAFVIESGIPALISVSPGKASQGQSLSLVITGKFTHFSSGTSVLAVGGVSVNTTTVSSPTTLTASITIASDALLGPRSVTVTTGSEVVTLANAFSVESMNTPPTITIAPKWALTLPSRLILTYAVADDGRPAAGALTTSWDKVSGPCEHGFTDQTTTSISAGFACAGTFVLRITATDTLETVTRDVVVTVTGVPADLPTLSITTPTEAQEITAPTEVRGTVIGDDLKSWTLERRRIDEPTFVPFAEGSASVTDGVLGTFDPTQLLNGTVELRLTATENSGRVTSSEPLSVVVRGNQKIGIFTVSFNDLTVPMPGIPIQVIRTYDSRDKIAGDFGVGWRLDLQTVRVSENGEAGKKWTGTVTGTIIKSYCVAETKPHIVSVTLPDNTVYQFKPELAPQCQEIVPLDQVSISFVPTGTTPPNVSLTPVGNTLAQLSGGFPGPMDLLDLDTLQPFDPNRYRLTLPDGRVMELNQGTGLEKMTDLSGNTLTITPAGITHSSGKSVPFVRDNFGRITQITDPAGSTLKYAYDGLGDLVSSTDRENQTTTYTYVDPHYLETIKDPRGIQPIRNEYDTSGRLIKHIDAFGKEIVYTHNIGTRQEIIQDRLGNVTVNEYDDQGNVVKVTDAEHGVTVRVYDSRSNMTKEVNPLGKVREYTYDANDNRLTEKDPLGKMTSYQYNSRNQVTKITDPLGRVTENTYNAAGNLISTKDAANQLTNYVYNGQGLQIQMTDAAGGVTKYEYNAAGNLTKQTDPLNHSTTYTYDANGSKKSETRTRTTSNGPETLITLFDYDKQNRLTMTTFPDGSTSRTEYNSIGKQSATFDQLNRKTEYLYDDLGRLIRTNFPDSTNEQAKYDAEGRRTESIDRSGRITKYTYDKLGRLRQTTFADTAVTETQYDAAGQVIASIDPRNNKTQYRYDDAGRHAEMIDALGHSTKFRYDDAGNQIELTDANGNKTEYQYDALNRRTKTVYADSTADQVSYDALGRTKSKTDQAGRATQFNYDTVGRLIEVIDALSQSTTYSYDEVGGRLTQTDANSHTTKFEYDKLGRRAKRILPLGMFETFAHDAAGNVKEKIDFNGRKTTYLYDAANRLTQKTPDPFFGAAPITFVYFPSGERSQMVDPSGTTTYIYDARGRLKSKAAPAGTLSYTYDIAGNLGSIRSSNAGGTSVDYAYDELNRLKTVVDNRLSGANTTTYLYDNAGNLKSFTYPNGVKHSYTYNELNRLKDLTVTNTSSTIASYACTLGPTGNRTKVVELGGRTVEYAYDSLYRLTSEAIAGGSVNGMISYLYDAVGNRKSRTSTVAPVPSSTYLYDINDRLTTNIYDPNGNTTTSGGVNYAYDFENRLLTKNGSEVVMVYDGDGNRASKTVGGTTTQYLVDERNLTGYAQVLEEVNGGSVQRVYTYGLNRVSQGQASATSFYGYDGHGSVRLLTDATGTVTDRYDYDAFGNAISQAGATSNVYLYSGEQHDPNLGFYYVRARYLSAGTGRFVSVDRFPGLVFEPLSLHRYTYALNDPVNRLDPSGNLSLPELGAAVSIYSILNQITLTHFVFGGFTVWVVLDFFKPGFEATNGALEMLARTSYPPVVASAIDLYRKGNALIAIGAAQVKVFSDLTNISKALVDLGSGVVKLGTATGVYAKSGRGTLLLEQLVELNKSVDDVQESVKNLQRLIASKGTTSTAVKIESDGLLDHLKSFFKFALEILISGDTSELIVHE